MSGVVNDQRNDNEIAEQIKWVRHQVLFAKKRPAVPVHVVLRPPEIIDGNNNPRQECLTPPTAADRTQSSNGPKQHRGHDDVKQAQTANQQRLTRSKTEFCSANKVPSRFDCSS